MISRKEWSLITVLMIIILISIFIFIIGMVGHRWMFDLNWVDSFYSTALTMAGLSLEVKPETNCQKIFLAVLTLLSVGFYLVVIAAIIACILEPVLDRAVEHGEKV